jgi:tryptophanase
MNQYPMEPFKIKSIEHIKITTKEERISALQKANYNLFNISSDLVMIDLLTDSGTGAMSDIQWSAIMTGDESYANSKSFENLTKVVNDIFNYKYFLPVHQGRAAEVILSSIMINKGSLIPSNNHFDTTAANILIREGTPIDLVSESNSNESFKGNMDIDKLDKFLNENNERVPFCMVTITNNCAGGQPVSLSNIEDINMIKNYLSMHVVLPKMRSSSNSESVFIVIGLLEISLKKYSHFLMVRLLVRKKMLL